MADLEVRFAREAYDSCVALRGPDECEAQARALGEANAKMDECTQCPSNAPPPRPPCAYPLPC